MPSDVNYRSDQTGVRELLRTTAAGCITADRRERMQALIASGVPWDRALAEAGDHGTGPLLYRSLRECGWEGVPEQVVETLRTQQRTQVACNLALAEELGRVTDACRAAGTRILSIKGPTLAVLGYGDLSLRSFLDLDLLVAPEDFERARAALATADCRPCYAMTPDEERFHVATKKQLPFRGRQGVLIELHATLTDDSYQLPLDFEELWSRRKRVMVAGRPHETLSTDDLCLLLAVHGAKHWWGRLKWICDFAQFLRPEFSLNWCGLIERSRGLGCETMLLLAAALARQVLDVDLPRPLAEACESNRKVMSLVKELEERLFSETPPRWPRMWEMRYHYRCHGRIGPTAKFLAEMLFQPHLADWQFVRLPRPLWSLYTGLRPLRLSVKQVRRLMGNDGSK